MSTKGLRVEGAFPDWPWVPGVKVRSEFYKGRDPEPFTMGEVSGVELFWNGQAMEIEGVAITATWTRGGEPRPEFFDLSELKHWELAP